MSPRLLYVPLSGEERLVRLDSITMVQRWTGDDKMVRVLITIEGAPLTLRGADAEIVWAQLRTETASPVTQPRGAVNALRRFAALCAAAWSRAC